MSSLPGRIRQRSRYFRYRFGPDNWDADGSRGALERLRSPNAPLLPEMAGDSRTLLIAFGGMQQAFGMPHFEFAKLARSLQVKRLFVRDLHQAWYHRGLPGHGRTLTDTAQALRRVMEENEVERLVTAGNSAGGYAALVFGTLLGAEAVLSFSPQTVLTLEGLAAIGDHRWDDRVIPLAAERRFDERWVDLGAALPSARVGDIRYEVYFGQANEADRLHAMNLAQVPGLRLYPMGEDRHFLVMKMRNNGTLERVLRRALGLDAPAAQSLPADGRTGLPQG